MKSIFTLKGQEILVDDEDFERVSAYRWQVSVRGYVRRLSKNCGKRSAVAMHRFILGIPNGDPRIVDHANGIKTDNRRSNLRVCTKSQNGYNQGPQKTNTTGFKGFTRHKKTGSFIARIRANGRSIHIGSFKTAESAHAAYCVKASELHGEFANFGVAARAAEIERKEQEK
ncbi:HNH endonuclease [Paraburkholderia sp. SIMBA_009]